MCRGTRDPDAALMDSVPLVAPGLFYSKRADRRQQSLGALAIHQRDGLWKSNNIDVGGIISLTKVLGRP